MYRYRYRYMFLLNAIGLSPGGSSTVHNYTQTVHRTTQLIWEEWGPWTVFASYAPAFALHLRKKHGKTSVRVAEECQLARWKQNMQNRTYITKRIRKYNNKNRVKIHRSFWTLHCSKIMKPTLSVQFKWDHDLTFTFRAVYCI